MIDITSSITGDSVPEKPSLKAGLLALKLKDYSEAIAHLEIISQQQPLKQQLKAQMGLVIAYERTKQVDKAISLCRNLSQSSDPETQTWASRNLKELLKRYPPQKSAQSTIDSPQNQELTALSQKNLETGFVPLNPTSNKSTPSKTNKKNSKNNSNLSVEKIDNLPEVKTGKSSASVHLSPPHQNDTVQKKLFNISADKPTASNHFNNSSSKTTKKSHQTFTNIPANISDRSPKLTWREAGRAKGGRPLKSPNLTRFFLEQIVVGIAIFWLSLTILKLSLDAINDLLVWLPYCQPIQLFYRDPTQNFVIFLLGLFIFSPWLTDGLLILGYGLKTLPTTTLISYSKEANKLLRSFCQKRKIRGITLKVLPIDVPIAFSYGWLPRFFRIVVSQGLLDKLAADEIATIYAREISHVQNGDFRLMSMATLMLQIPYNIYWQLTFGADWVLDFVNYRLPEFLPGSIKSLLPFLVSGLRILAATISTLSYGLYWLLKLPILWLSRRRIYYSDRVACNLTGNPNGLTRALLKITIAMAEDVQNQGKIRNLLESFELLMPVGINQAISIGSVVSSSGFESIFNWDIVNPYRQWLEVNNSHPLLGGRLKMLGLYANFWKLETELNLGNINTDVNSKNQAISTDQKENISHLANNFDWRKLLLQGAPFFGMLIGLVFAGLLWLIGGISDVVGIWRLDWLLGDISTLVGCVAIGFSIGILIRINHFFPDLKPSKLLQNPDLVKLLSDPEALPLDSQPIQLKGQLLGKNGMSNWLGQDLILQTTKGLVKLHYSDQLGPVGNLWPKVNRPSDFVGKSITVTGWWRRGATPWIDINNINNLQADHRRTIQSGHPIWSTIVAFTIAIWGTYMIYVGRF